MKIDYEPHKYQKMIHKALRPINDGHIVMVIAGRRFGKTLLAVAEMAKRALQKPGSRIWYIAPTKEQAYMIAWRLLTRKRIDKDGKIHEPLLPTSEVKKIREDKHYVELKNGSLIEFMGVTSEIRLLGAGLSFAVFDEFINIPYSVWYDTVRPMLIYSRGDALFIGTIPDPKVHNITIDFLDMFEEANEGTLRRGKAFTFPSISNPHLDKEMLKEQIEDLVKKGRGDDARRLYEGDYTREHGLVFPVFSREEHTCEPFRIPSTWTRVMAIDPHPQKPIYALWGAIDLKYNWWIYREKKLIDMNNRPLTVQEAAYEISLIENKEKEKVWRRFIDPTYAKMQQNIIGQKSLRDMFRSFGLMFQEADRTFITFFNNFTDRLVEVPNPSIKIFNTCEGLIRQIGHYVWDSWASSWAREEKGVKDKPKKVDDDFIDCLKFILNSNVTPIQIRKETMSAYKDVLKQRWAEENKSLS